MAENGTYANNAAFEMSPTSQADVSPCGRPEKSTASKPSGAVKNYSRWAAVCLGLLCVLLLALNIGLGIKCLPEKRQLQAEREHLLASHVNITMERDQVSASNTNLTRQVDQLLASHVNITMERDQALASNTNLTRQVDQLLASHVNITMERDQTLASNTNLTRQVDQLLASYVNITMERDQALASNTNLTRQVDQLLASYVNITMERDQALASNTNLTRQVDQLLSTNDQLQDRFSELKKRGWRYFNSSWYLISSTDKTWSEGRQQCKDIGGDLVIINSEEEQVFIHGLSLGFKAWIGLMEIQGVWKWVDNTQLSTSYWDFNEPNPFSEECALINGYAGDPLLKWHDYPCHVKYSFICEMSGFL
ncbi:uncharacterized protein LOC143133776 [Alosa pseudoharengus]|uniref:uncharacterized protein LOC143133776 n=1 Tax=Alosa pseudoharengus TaxID=34774 RepID=UPI003F89C657